MESDLEGNFLVREMNEKLHKVWQIGLRKNISLY